MSVIDGSAYEGQVNCTIGKGCPFCGKGRRSRENVAGVVVHMDAVWIKQQLKLGSVSVRKTNPVQWVTGS